MKLAENIKWIRLLKGLSQAKFGDLLGVSKDAVYTYEVGRTVPNVAVLSKIATMAGVSISDLEKKDLKNLTIHVINPDTKKVEFTLAPNGANQQEIEIEHLRQLLLEKEKQIKLLTQLIEKSSKKS
jgi:transcriptional regulator with XRE-family HTH domain